MPRLYCGTSGFSYPGWKPDFYPADAPPRKFLHFYSQRLNAVEINYTFHRLPTQATLEGWLAETAPGFTFVLKAHQRITHIERLAVTGFTHAFFKAIDPLRIQGRLGPVLFQLPPNLAADIAKLEAFLAALPEDLACAFEFRHKSWLEEPVFEMLERRKAALCLAESDKLVIPQRVTSQFVYFRLRKAEYTAEDRAGIATKVRGLLADGKDVYAFFKHEDTPAGALYAEELLRTAA